MKRFGRRTFLTFVSASAALLQLSGLPAAQAQTPKNGGTLVATWGGFEPQALFVPAGGGGAPEFTSTKVLEPMLTLDSDLNFHPALATDVTPASDFLSYKIKIREGVTWHDGKPLTVDDIIFNADKYWKPVVAGPALQFYTGIKQTGPNEVTVSFSQPTPEFFFKSVLARVLVIPKHLYDGKEFATNPANNVPIGTGPFKFKEWVRGSHVAYTKNENYWNKGEPHLDNLIIRYWRDPSSRTAAMEAGELQMGVFNPVPAADIKRLVDSGKFVASSSGYLTSAWASTIEFNSRNPIVKDPLVRKAIMHAIDKNFVVDVVFSGRAKAGKSFVSSTNTKFHTGDVEQYKFDPELAKKMLDQAGYPSKNGAPRFSVKLVAAGWFPENGRIGQYVKQQLEDIGVAVELTVPDRPTSFKVIYGDYAFDIAVGNHAAPVELVPVQTNYVTTSGILKGVPFRNANGYSNPELDAVVAKLAVETDETKRTDLARQFQTILARDVPITILAEIESITVASKQVKGYEHLANVLADSWSTIWLDR